MIKLTRHYNGAFVSSITLSTDESILEYIKVAPAAEKYLINECIWFGCLEPPYTEDNWTYSIERIK